MSPLQSSFNFVSESHFCKVVTDLVSEKECHLQMVYFLSYDHNLYKVATHFGKQNRM